MNKLLAPITLVIARRSTKNKLFLSQSSAPLVDVNVVLKEIQRTLLRNQIAVKWSTVDFLIRRALEGAAIRICPLCGYKAADIEFRKLRSHCIFGGGDLLRHACPHCDLIYGPDKMFDLTDAELSEDYEWHYKAYDEGDSTERELRTFFSLKPDKQGVYLNYGAGCWSESVQKLRTLGWNVYAYEPHNSALNGVSCDWLICSSEQLRHMRFDGIFSNNVLEHFRHPVQELKSMTQLLRAGARMAHATPCYEYLYEYTRFHLFFFVGKSKDLLMQQANVQLVDEIIDGDFICRVMKPSAQSESHV
jgi:hypothetical protein